jgi:O-antigen/teichoic acid export membrane protein
MLIALKQRLLEHRFLRSVLTLVSASVVGQLILVLITPLLTRLYKPNDFGVLAVFVAIMAIVLVVSSFRYELSIPLPKPQRNAKNLLVISLLLNAMISLVCLVAVLVFRKNIADLNQSPVLANYLLLLPIAVLGGGTYKALNYWAVRNNAYSAIATTRVVQSVANALVQLLSGVAGIGSLGLILGQVIGQTAGALRLAKGLKLDLAMVLRRSERLRSRILLKRYIKFPKYDVPASFADQVSSQLPNILLAALFSPSIAGLYILADRVLSMPISLLGQAVGQVLFGASRKAIEAKKLSVLAARVGTVLIAVALVPSVILFFYAADIFSWVFGPEWREAGVYAGWMILGVSVQLVYSPLSMLLMATDGQRLNLMVHMTMLAAKIVVVLYGYREGEPLIAIMGFSLVGLIGYFTATMIVLLHTRRHDKTVNA